MRTLFLPALLFVFSCAIHAQSAAEISVLVPSGDVSAALGEDSTRWRMFSSSPSFALADGITQKNISRSESAAGVTLRIRTADFSSPAALSSAERSSYLASTRFVHPQDAQIRAIAEKISREKDPVRAAEDFVSGFISNKELGMPLATDLQVLSLRAGDCKEHAVLLVSILRAAGIPSRAVAGMVLLPSFAGRTNVFGFHMWAEAYAGGKWVLADATFSGQRRPNRYIALASHSLRTASPLDYMDAVSRIQNLSVTRE